VCAVPQIEAGEIKSGKCLLAPDFASSSIVSLLFVVIAFTKPFFHTLPCVTDHGKDVDATLSTIVTVTDS